MKEETSNPLICNISLQKVSGSSLAAATLTKRRELKVYVGETAYWRREKRKYPRASSICSVDLRRWRAAVGLRLQHNESIVVANFVENRLIWANVLCKQQTIKICRMLYFVYLYTLYLTGFLT
jgi:hypothetical protein